jgi:hypothetical protein
MATVTLTVEVPDIVANVMEAGLAVSTTVLIVPDAHRPGWVGTIVQKQEEASDG